MGVIGVHVGTTMNVWILTRNFLLTSEWWKYLVLLYMYTSTWGVKSEMLNAKLHQHNTPCIFIILKCFVS